jgi:predicted RecB family nuclease
MWPKQHLRLVPKQALRLNRTAPTRRWPACRPYDPLRAISRRSSMLAGVLLPHIPEGLIMTTKITRDVLESHLNCKYKGHLKLTGQAGTKADYDILWTEQKAEVRRVATAKILAVHPPDKVAQKTPLTVATLRLGLLFLFDGMLEDDFVCLSFDGLRRVEGPSRLGDFHYLPMLFCPGERIPREQRLLLGLYGVILAEFQGKQPGSGLIIHGKQGKVTKVQFAEDIRRAQRLLGELKEKMQSGAAPRLTLNDHCPVCEFRQRCHDQAMKDDDLSLLGGISEQEIGRQNRKGIFTVRQLSYTFRARRRNKRAKNQAFPRSFALQALAIRENKVHVHGSFTVPASPTSIYLDIEGLPDHDRYYLIGLVVVENGVESRHWFWADSEEEQPVIFTKLLERLGQYPEYCLFSFGNYEAKALRRIKGYLPEEQQQQIEAVLNKVVNVLSIIYPHVYFPTYSCRLKDIGRSIGCSWSEPDASGLQSVVWRAAWERSWDEALKAKLVRYNTEDCLALKAVVEFLIQVASTEATGTPGSLASPHVVHTTELQSHTGRRHRFGKKESSLPGFDYVNQCAYFDHQRDKVFVRTNPRLKVIQQQRRRARRSVLPINKVVELSCKRCPSCNSRKLFQMGGITQQIIDLKYFRDGVKRCITKYVSWHYSCSKCRAIFTHPEFPQVTTKYGRRLISWCIYQNIAGGQNLHRVRKVLTEVFKLPLASHLMYRFKTAVAESYQATYGRILDEILKGSVIHIDETEVNLRGGKGYVWVLTNMEQVYFFFRDSREGTFLREMLRGFTGVLVSDFFTAYDSLDCSQQKCLIHLLRDLNEDVLKNPFDEEFKILAHGFAALLRTVVATIDRYGLKQRHLHKHRAAVEAFFDQACSKEAQSEIARGYQKRFEKYRSKLFTFLDYDGIPWNNNNAEHALKCFAKYREFADGRFTEASIKDYLVILSLYQTCEYQGVHFLDFLRDKGRDGAGDFGSGRRGARNAHGKGISTEQSCSDPGATDQGDPATEQAGQSTRTD